jgi:HSP20 family protein
MTLVPGRGLWELRFPTLKDEMDKLFEDFFGRTGFPSIQEGGWLPAVDVNETKKDVVVTLDLPAINPKEVSICIVDDRLTIKGERKREEETKEENYYRSERMYGTFQRVLQLPAEVMGDKAKATYKDGVLKITVPKSQKAVPKEIKIEVE